MYENLSLYQKLFFDESLPPAFSSTLADALAFECTDAVASVLSMCRDKTKEGARKIDKPKSPISVPGINTWFEFDAGCLPDNQASGKGGVLQVYQPVVDLDPAIIKMLSNTFGNIPDSDFLMSVYSFKTVVNSKPVHLGVLGVLLNKSMVVRDVVTLIPNQDPISASLVVVCLRVQELLSCKNVIVEDTPPLRYKRMPGKKNRRPKSVTFKTLKIIAPKDVKRYAEGTTDEKKSITRQHICRGHIKDYTEGRGLFGKYKIRIYVPQMVRGNKDIGRVEKDYEV